MSTDCNCQGHRREKELLDELAVKHEQLEAAEAKLWRIERIICGKDHSVFSSAQAIRALREEVATLGIDNKKLQSEVENPRQRSGSANLNLSSKMTSLKNQNEMLKKDLVAVTQAEITRHNEKEALSAEYNNMQTLVVRVLLLEDLHSEHGKRLTTELSQMIGDKCWNDVMKETE